MAKVDLHVDDRGVARVTINRPEVRNALDPQAQHALHDIWDHIEADRSIRVVVLTGAGDRSFCAGSDMKTPGARGVEYWSVANPNGYGGLTVRESLTVPVIARVNGYVLGGGLELMLGADLVVMADHAEIGMVEPRVGRVPLDGGIPRLVGTVGRLQVMEILLTGRRIGAAQALSMGLANRVVPQADLDDEVETFVADILACAPLSVRAVKAIATVSRRMHERDVVGLRIPEVVEALNSRDADEGVTAFLERRVPQWSGS